MKLNTDPTGYVDLTTSLGSTIKLHGFQYGEKFGHALCAVDINGDGYDDLVVGAPFNSGNDQVIIYLPLQFLNKMIKKSEPD